MKEDKKYYERLNEEYDKNTFGKIVLTAYKLILVGMIILLIASYISSCDKEEPLQQEKQPYYVTRHDAIPESMLGEWVSISDNTEIKLIITDRFVMGENFRIDPELDNAVNIDNKMYSCFQNGNIYILSFGTGQYSEILTLTIDNKRNGKLLWLR